MSDKPSYAVGVVPTNKPKLNWREHFKVAEDYEKFIMSGMFWVWFGEDEDEIAAWYREQKESLKAKKEYVENTRLDNYVASMHLEGMNREKED